MVSNFVIILTIKPLLLDMVMLSRLVGRKVGFWELNGRGDVVGDLEVGLRIIRASILLSIDDFRQEIGHMVVVCSNNGSWISTAKF